MQELTRRITSAEHQTRGPGEQAERLVPGDFVLTHGRIWTSKLIRFGQRLPFRGDERKCARWNHVALIVDPNGDLIEALGGRVQRRNISVYKPTEYTVVGAEVNRRQVVDFAMSTLDRPYGFVTILSIAWGLLTGGSFTFSYDGQHICSGLVARSLERTNAILNRTPSHIMKADLAKAFSVEPGPGVPIGVAPPARLEATTA